MSLAWRDELDQFDQVRAETVRLIEPLSQRELDYRTNPESWSANQIVDHILRAETLYRGEIQELVHLSLEGRPPRLRRTFSDVDVSLFFIPKFMLPVLDVPFTVFNLFVPAPLREWMTRVPIVAASNPRVAEPVANRPAAEVLSALKSSSLETRAVFEANPDLDYYRMFHQHPLMGVNNALQLVRFIYMHEQRHQEQIRKVLAARNVG